MRKILLFSLLLAAFAFPVKAQRIITITGGTVTANVTDNPDFLVNLTMNVTGVTLTSTVTPATGYIVSMKFVQDATGSRTVAFGGNITTSCSVNGTAGAVTICRWQYTASGNTWADAGGGSSVSPNLPGAIPGEPGVNAVPVTSGLLAEYRILSTETPAALVDYSGNGRNATGTVGTAPTIIAVPGGIQCNANGAVLLPASVNGARDIFLYLGFQSNFPGIPGTATFAAPILGNGNGTTTNAAGFLIMNYGLNTNYVQYANTIGGVANGAPTGNSMQSVNGNFLVEWDIGDPNDRTFINGVEIQYTNDDGGPASSTGINTFPFQLCGAAAGSGLGTQSYMQGQIYYVAMYSSPLTAAQRANVSAYILNAMTLRNAPPIQQLTTIATDTAAFIGDSMLTGTGNATTLAATVPHSVTLNGTWTTINNAMPGATVAKTAAPSNSSAAAGTQLFQQFYQPLAQRNVAVVMYGTNDDCAVNLSAAVYGAGYAKLIKNAKTAGFRVAVATFPSCTGGGGDASKNTFNALTRQLWRQWGADTLVDIASDPSIGADGQSANTTFFLDGVHWTAQSLYNNATPIFQRAINRLFGITDFSAATPYVAAATAAVATTAGSETANTITVTFGATPANCQVGNTIAITGTTPAGYSGNWTILTRSATQVTYWTNTTGLGAITVQGTGVCSQMQDADQYIVVNFGAGNFTLQSSVGYTGQCINIRNINAAATTLVSFGSETITGAGATPTTLAANTTAILCSQLVSAAAGGSNWVRTQ